MVWIMFRLHAVPSYEALVHHLNEGFLLNLGI